MQQPMSEDQCRKNEGWLDRPVLIYGPNKSGTTLLQYLLDGGRYLLVYPGELKLKSMRCRQHESSRERTTGFLRNGRGDFQYWLQAGEGPEGAPMPRAIAARTIGRLKEEDMSEHFDQESYLLGLSAFQTESEVADAEILKYDTRAFRTALKDDGNEYRCWASKEVGGDPNMISEYFLTMFPAGRIVYLAREPRSVVRSFIRDRRSRMKQRPSLKQIARRCHQTQKFVDFYARIDEQLGNSILVLYEELVRDPEREIRRIMDFLELPFEEIQTKPTIFGRNVVVVTSSRETRAVFDNTQTTWTQDLTLREKIAIGGYFWLLRCVARFRGRRPATYDDLRRA